MTTNQTQIVYMISRLKGWNQTLGSSNARKKLAGSQFDAWQEQFLVKRHQTQKLQSQKESQGLNTKTASHGYKIREGIVQMETSLGKMKEQNRKLTKKKADTPQNLARRQKIIANCQKLLQDVQQRQKSFNDPNGFNKPTKILTLTDMRVKLLTDIQQQNYQIHQQGSEGALTQHQDQIEAMDKFKKKDDEMENALDGIIDGIIGITGKVKGINKRQDQIIQKTKKTNNQVGQVSKRIQTDNDKLKKIIKQFGPSRCCLGLVLFLLFVGLVVVVLKMIVLG